MKLLKKKDVSTKSMNKNSLGVKKTVAVVLLLVTTLFVVSELVTYTTWAMPLIAIQLFQMAGIGIESGMTIANFAIGDMAVMFMMWILPCLFVLGLSLYVHAKLLKWYFKKFVSWLKVIFTRKSKNSDKLA